jgi:rhamnosyltransferase
MSTYNGERFLQQQVDSIIRQEGVNVHLLVRDDGSTDQTLSMLEQYKEKGALDYYQGENLGSARSFMQLLKDAPAADYYAFSDQDDYWLQDKLWTAVQHIGNTEGPALYFCQTQLADKDLNHLPTPKLSPLGTFGESLVYQFIGGCTMVMNKALRDIVITYEPKFLQMHDVWIYCIAQAINAHICYDPTPHILYRQHDRNVVGQGYGQLKEWRRRFRRVVQEGRQERYHIAVELHQGFKALMSHENAELLNQFILAKHSIAKRIPLMFDKRLRCASNGTYHKFILSLLFNTY